MGEVARERLLVLDDVSKTTLRGELNRKVRQTFGDAAANVCPFYIHHFLIVCPLALAVQQCFLKETQFRPEEGCNR